MSEFKLEKFEDRADEINIIELKDEMNKIVDDLKSTLESNDKLLYVSAPQLGYDKRIFCMKFANEIKTFVNPMITKKEGLHISRETDMCLPNREFLVPRNDRIMAMYYTPNGVPENNMFEELASELFQHCVNHLDGCNLDDFGLEIDEEFDKATEDERAELVKYYLETLKQKNDELQDEIQNDEELKKMDEAIKFMTGIATGEIEYEPPQPILNRKQRRLMDKLTKKAHKGVKIKK